MSLSRTIPLLQARVFPPRKRPFSSIHAVQSSPLRHPDPSTTSSGCDSVSFRDSVGPDWAKEKVVDGRAHIASPRSTRSAIRAPPVQSAAALGESRARPSDGLLSPHRNPRPVESGAHHKRLRRGGRDLAAVDSNRRNPNESRAPVWARKILIRSAGFFV